MLTYATLEDFKIAKQIKNITSGNSGISQEKLALADSKIIDYLARATRHVNNTTHREFFPYREVRKFPVPHAFGDLQMRRFLFADLYLDEDLLEVIEFKNGNGDILTEGEDFFFQNTNIYPHYAVALKFPNYWGGMYNLGILSRTFDEPIIQVTGIWGYHDKYPRKNEAWVDTLDTVTVAINDTTTSISVADADGKDGINTKRFTEGYLLKIDSEFVEITEVDTTGNTLTVLRGARGTTAAEHDAGAKIYRWRVIEDIVEATMQIAKTWREADTAAGGRLGVGEMSAGVEIGIPGDPLTIIKMYQKSFVGL